MICYIKVSFKAGLRLAFIDNDLFIKVSFKVCAFIDNDLLYKAGLRLAFIDIDLLYKGAL